MRCKFIATRRYALSTQAFLVPLLAVTLLATNSAQSQESVLYSFQGGSDGQWPIGRMVFDSVGNLYGATEAGGSQSCLSFDYCGTVYQLAPPAQPGGLWTETVLHVFEGHATGDGSFLFSGLLRDKSGNLYGATGYGGTGSCTVLGTFTGCGTVYELSPPSEKGGAWVETVLYSFQGGEDGYLPYGDLVFDNAGNLYGATLYGGGSGTNCGDAYYPYCGTVFELSPPVVQGGAWTEQVLYGFKGVERGALIGDGANPNGGLAFDGVGAIYGTTQIGGFNCPHGSGRGGCGTAFKLTPPAKKGQPWAETIIHRFLSGADGAGPLGGLTSSASGGFFGTTASGGLANTQEGTVFQLLPQPNGNWTKYLLYSFDGLSDGSEPAAGLLLDAEGDLYGTAMIGAMGNGTVYELLPTAMNAGLLEVLHDFTKGSDGAQPRSELVFDTAGKLYGNTSEGGTGSACGFEVGCGTVFSVDPPGDGKFGQTFEHGRK